jgi:tRNA dimethylallyltransferase
MAAESPVVVIVGPTASGKTGLAIELAQKHNGEIICADSRTIYKGMDVGTAKPTAQEQAGIPHWGLDLVEPTERYTAADFKRYVDDKIAEIKARGKLPIIVGGTGLYVDAVIFDYQFPRPMTDEDRKVFEQMTRDELIEYCIKYNIELPVDDKNKRRLIRAINDPNQKHKRNDRISDNIIVVGIATDKNTLIARIRERTEQMFNNAVVEEATLLGKKYGWNAEAMTSNVYRVIKLYLDGELTLEETKEKFTTRDVQLAKRQMTWFRRNPDIMWTALTEANTYVARQLVSEQKI